MLARLPLHAKRGSLAETAAWATKQVPTFNQRPASASRATQVSDGCRARYASNNGSRAPRPRRECRSKIKAAEQALTMTVFPQRPRSGLVRERSRTSASPNAPVRRDRGSVDLQYSRGARWIKQLYRPRLGQGAGVDTLAFAGSEPAAPCPSLSARLGLPSTAGSAVTPAI
jgi:hypothetical protein